ncbi:ABC transporter A family member 3 [Vitis vinifera]|uniref:ABC transporter A family member 3 n=1 Tax=Vitis vinifera TaxID=29760 RepID=A0A438I1D0_VITVI|nr:ABC transporter A family member 3 [Vitis vinifera]
MADSSSGPASFWTQANALLRKNLTFQKRNIRTNIRLVSFPILLCVLLVVIQKLVNSELDKAENKCGCISVTNENGQTEKRCGIQYSTLDQVGTCPIPSPPEWPALLQVPAPEYRAVRADFIQFTDLPDDSCRRTGSCPATILFTGNNRSLGLTLAGNMFSEFFLSKFLQYSGDLNQCLRRTNFLDPAFFSDLPIYHVEPQCAPNSTFSVSFSLASTNVQQEIQCVQGLHLWRNSSSEINDELFKGYHKGNSERKINEIVAGASSIALVRVPRSVNLVTIISGYLPGCDLLGLTVSKEASNAYLQLVQGDGVKMVLDFIKEMPKPETQVRLDLSLFLVHSSLRGSFCNCSLLCLTSLVYEKQQNLRIMMKMHGLGDGPYWMISYAYFLVISSIYMLCFVIFGSVIGLKFFTLNDYSIQLVFYFIYINLQISLAFLLAAAFSNVKTATVLGYICVFGTGLLGGFLFQFFIQDTSFPILILRKGISMMSNCQWAGSEQAPNFASANPSYGGMRWGHIKMPWVGQKYHLNTFADYLKIWLDYSYGVISWFFSISVGLYEFAQYSFTGNYMGTDGMRWGDLSDSTNGMRDVLIIMFVEWLIVLFVAYYIDQVLSSGNGVKRSPLFFLQNFRKKKAMSSFRKPSLKRQGSKVFVKMEKADVSQELFIYCRGRRLNSCYLNLVQIMPSSVITSERCIQEGMETPKKLAVKGLSLALSHGECFGMLGPNGAGKTSFISMMIGLTVPTSGTAFVEGLDIRIDMDGIYTSMGSSLGTLTGREHLLFYGRLKNLKGAALTQAVEESLKSVNLFHGGVGDKQAGKYSGGMKRRLSVAISLIGDPKVVYMDEPSTGLDPASRNNLWNVVKRAKQGRAIILTTHSMEEAEVLCDRLGIFVDGSLQCIGNPKELKARYGGSYVFTMTTSSNHEEEWRTWCGNSPQTLTKYTKFLEPRSLSFQSKRSGLQMFSKQLRMQRAGSQFKHGVWLTPL